MKSLKQLLIGAAIAATATAHAANYYVVVPFASKAAPPPAANITVSLNSYSLPQGLVGSPYSFDFQSVLSVVGDPAYSATNASFKVASGELPAGLNLSDSGVLSGTPTTKNLAGSSFEVLATYKTKSGQQAYTISVDGVLMNVTQLAVGESRACAVTTTGGLKCWGRGLITTASTPNTSSTPRDVDGLSTGVSGVVLGRDHNCIVTTNGAAKCWGANSYGQLGIGTLNGTMTPTSPTGLDSNVSQISAGTYYTCALKNSGELLCWGANGSGQVGTNTGSGPVTTPTTVFSSGVTKVSTAENLTCAIVSSAAKCWGSNQHGETGMGAVTSYSLGLPQQVVGLTSGVTEVSAARGFACAIHSGAAKCWGHNIYGNLGNGTTTWSTSPVLVAGVGGQFTSLTAQAYGMCGRTSAGAAYCWGHNAQGQLGNGSTTRSSVPVMVSGLSDGVVAVDSDPLSQSTCAITTTGVKCWGVNTYGQLGDGTTTSATVPVNVAP